MPREPLPPVLPVLTLPCAPGTAALDDREWLVTNGLGGYASGPVAGPPTRRQHGLFVPNLPQPEGRHVLLPRLEDGIETAAGRVPLAYADGPGALREFRLDGATPVWRFDVGGSIVERDLVMPHGVNAMCVRWRLIAGPPCRLWLRPYVGARRHDEPFATEMREPFRPAPAAGAGDAATLDLIPALPADVRLRLHVQGRALRFVPAAQARCGLHFAIEQARGYDHVEHQHSPGEWCAELAAGSDVAFFAGTGDDIPAFTAGGWFAAERDRLAALLAGSGADVADAVEARLVLAADAFVVLPASRRGDQGPDASAFRSVIAGYHWFTDWGRDTMIALEGLTLATGRQREARAILSTFGRYVRDGLLPNLFPEGGHEGLYHTVDATLWYFHALDRYERRSGDHGLVRELLPTLRDVVDHHVRGTRFGIGVDAADGLLAASAAGYQLTWMDAKMGDWVVTPRRGKPVEIQALWFNALRLISGWAQRLGAAAEAERYRLRADAAGRAFAQRFWCDSRGHLYDVIDGPEGDDASLRPNQVFALSLAHPVLDASRRPQVLDVLARALLTPYGLRTLAPGEPAYQPRYAGDLRSRDGAYHQGTVWPWLLGHFVDAWVRVHGAGPATRDLLRSVPQQLHEAGVGQISEVFDAEPPHRPGGCIAQAWSVAELLRAWQLSKEPADG